MIPHSVALVHQPALGRLHPVELLYGSTTNLVRNAV